MSMDRCSICQEWKYSFKEHHCASVYQFKHENYGEEYEDIRAYSFEDAAERFAKKYNEDGDYSLMNTSTEVTISDGKEEKKFTVSAEPDINYSVDEIN